MDEKGDPSFEFLLKDLTKDRKVNERRGSIEKLETSFNLMVPSPQAISFCFQPCPKCFILLGCAMTWRKGVVTMSSSSIVVTFVEIHRNRSRQNEWHFPKLNLVCQQKEMEIGGR